MVLKADNRKFCPKKRHDRDLRMVMCFLGSRNSVAEVLFMLQIILKLTDLLIISKNGLFK